MDPDSFAGQSLVFVYNANSGLLNLLADAAHRVISPKTYPCRLCAITYSFDGMRREWKAFLRTLPLPVEFLHRDELAEKYGVAGIRLPAVFIHEEDCTELLIPADRINGCHSLDELKSLVSEAIADNHQQPILLGCWTSNRRERELDGV